MLLLTSLMPQYLTDLEPVLINFNLISLSSVISAKARILARSTGVAGAGTGAAAAAPRCATNDLFTHAHVCSWNETSRE